MNFRVLSAFLLIFLSTSVLFAETVYLKDGQILNGKILKEDDEAITIETRFQTKTIEKKYITRVSYNISLEPVQIVTKDNDLIKGYLVLQDSTRVVYKKTEDDLDDISIPRDRVKSVTIGTPPSDNINILTDDGKILSGEMIYQDKEKVIIRSEDEPRDEQVIEKDDIVKISYDAIRIYDSEVLLLPGLGIPLSTGGADLGPAPAVFIGYLINNPFINNTRFLFLSGYCNPVGKSDDRANLQMIPVTANLLYVYPFKHFDLIPGIGIGASMLYYKNLRGDSFFGIKPLFKAGIGGSYELLKESLFLKCFIDYAMIFDSGETLSALFFTVGVGYRIIE